MGVTHSMKATYPRLGDVIGFVTPEQTLDACRIVMLIQRDTGNRANRKQARLKYTIDKHWGGADNFKAEVERRLGYKLAEPGRTSSRPTPTLMDGARITRATTIARFGSRTVVSRTNWCAFRTGLRELCKIHKGAFRFTPNQHVIVSDIKPEDKDAIDAHLRKYKMNNWSTRVSSSALRPVSLSPLVVLPWPNRERYLPLLMDKVEAIFEANGLRSTDTVFRMSGCANGCSRPWMAEAGFVGKAPGQYVMTLGGFAQRYPLSKIYRESVDEKEILEIMNKLVPQYAQNRLEVRRSVTTSSALVSSSQQRLV